MADSKTATVALTISVISIIFTFFQWWWGQQQHRIDVAVELSRVYVTDTEVATRYAHLLELVPEHIPEESPEGFTTLLPIRSYVDLIDYISHLANEGQIDNAYVAERIKCDIFHVTTKFRASPKFKERFRVTEIFRYVDAQRHADCSDSRQNGGR